MSENYPPGIAISAETIDLKCSQCEHEWSASVTIELGTIVEDDYDMCPLCGVRTQQKE